VAKAASISPIVLAFEDLDLQPEDGGGFLHLPQRGGLDRSIHWIDENGDSNGVGNQVMQQS
jgi:hypothetical protein